MFILEFIMDQVAKVLFLVIDITKLIERHIKI